LLSIDRNGTELREMDVQIKKTWGDNSLFKVSDLGPRWQAGQAGFGRSDGYDLAIANDQQTIVDELISVAIESWIIE